MNTAANSSSRPDCADLIPSTPGPPIVGRTRWWICHPAGFSGGTAAKYRNTTTAICYLAGLDAALPCSAATMVAAAWSSGRRGRRFKSCHPDQCRRSLTCINAALRRPAFHSSPPVDAPKEQKRNTREPQGKPGPNPTGRRNTRPPRTAQQTPRHRRDRQGTLIPRPQRRGRLVGTPARQEAVRSEVGKLGTVNERPHRRKIQSTLEPSTTA